MHPSCLPLRCRSRNAFAPSAALWQYFVASSAPGHYSQRLSYAFVHTGTDSPADLPRDQSDPATPPQTVTNPDSSPIRKYVSDGATSEWITPDGGGLDREDTLLSSPALKIRFVNDEKSKNPRAVEAPKPNAKQLAKIQEAMAEARSQLRNRGHYTGVHFLPPLPQAGDRKVRLLINQEKLPWAVRDASVTGMERLEQEIVNFSRYARPSSDEAIARTQLVSQVIIDVKETLPDFNIELFGSEKTGLALALSDIDLRLYDPSLGQSALPPAPPDRKKMVDLLHALRKKLWRCTHPTSLNKYTRRYKNIEVVHSRYPLISLQDSETGLTVQIVLANDSSPARAAIARYLAEYPFLKDLFPVVKTMMDVRQLSDVYNGGFGSYSLFMMLVASLKHSPPANNAAEGLLTFLKFHWKTHKGLSIEPPVRFSKLQEPVGSPQYLAQLASGEKKPHPDWMLCLRDPADPTNDLGRKGASILHLIRTLQHLNQAVIVRLMSPEEGKGFLFPLIVGSVYDLHREGRKQLSECGTRFVGEHVAPGAVWGGKSLKARLKNLRCGFPGCGLAGHTTSRCPLNPDRKDDPVVFRGDKVEGKSEIKQAVQRLQADISAKEKEAKRLEAQILQASLDAKMEDIEKASSLPAGSLGSRIKQVSREITEEDGTVKAEETVTVAEAVKAAAKQEEETAASPFDFLRGTSEPNPASSPEINTAKPTDDFSRIAELAKQHLSESSKRTGQEAAVPRGVSNDSLRKNAMDWYER